MWVGPLVNWAWQLINVQSDQQIVVNWSFCGPNRFVHWTISFSVFFHINIKVVDPTTALFWGWRRWSSLIAFWRKKFFLCMFICTVNYPLNNILFNTFENSEKFFFDVLKTNCVFAFFFDMMLILDFTKWIT